MVHFVELILGTSIEKLRPLTHLLSGHFGEGLAVAPNSDDLAVQTEVAGVALVQFDPELVRALGQVLDVDVVLVLVTIILGVLVAVVRVLKQEVEFLLGLLPLAPFQALIGETHHHS